MSQNTLINISRKNQGISKDVGGKGVNKDIKNLVSIIKSAGKPNFAKSNSFGAEFLTSKAKKTFTHLRNTFTKALIL